MRRYVVVSVMLFPLLLSFSHAAQSRSMDVAEDPVVFSSEDEGSSGHLGVSVADVNKDRLSALKLNEEKGVEVTVVDQDAPAGKAGIKEHDVILTMNGTAIESAAQLRRMIRETPPGRVITLGLSRDGQPVTIKVQLAAGEKDYYSLGPNMKDFHIQIPEIHIPDIDIPSMNMVVVSSSARSGLTVENITAQLGEFFGVKNGNGVLVRAVEKGSRAEKAGFRAGDVIVKVNDQSVHDTGDFAHAVRSRNGAAISVWVIRDKKEQNLNLALPDNKESGDLFENNEESFQGPLIDAESAVELGQLRQEVAELQPQLEVAAEDARTSVRELRNDLCQQQRKVRQQTEKLKNQSRLEQRQLMRNQQKLKMQLDRLRQERRHSLDI
jgi:serine protease Do